MPKLGDFNIDIGIDIEMVQIAILFLVLVSKSSFPIIDIVIGFEINACQPEILISNLNEQFCTALLNTLLLPHHQMVPLDHPRMVISSVPHFFLFDPFWLKGAYCQLEK